MNGARDLPTRKLFMVREPSTVRHDEPSPEHFRHLSSRADEPSIMSQPTDYKLKQTNVNPWTGISIVEIGRTYLTLSINANIQRFIIASCAIDDFRFMAIIKTFAARHAVEFARIGRFCVGHPIVSYIFKQLVIEMRALLLTEIDITFGTILQTKCIYMKIPSNNLSPNCDALPEYYTRNISYFHLNILDFPVSYKKTFVHKCLPFYSFVVIWSRFMNTSILQSFASTYSICKHSLVWYETPPPHDLEHSDGAPHDPHSRGSPSPPVIT